MEEALKSAFLALVTGAFFADDLACGFICLSSKIQNRDKASKPQAIAPRC